MMVATCELTSVTKKGVSKVKKLILASLIFSLALGAAAYAQAPGDYGPGWGMGWGRGMGWGPGMGPGMMRGGPGPYGQPPCAGWGGPGSAQSQVTEENAKTAVQQYTDKYFTGYKIERILPFATMSGMTMYQAELTGPDGVSRVLRVNPWGNVMPFGGPQARAK
jgi:hypothetical protein